MGFSAEHVSAFVAMIGILSMLGQVSCNFVFNIYRLFTFFSLTHLLVISLSLSR